MKSFYQKTDKFWIFSRIFFTLLLIIAVIIVFFDSDFELRSLIGLSILGIYISLIMSVLIRRAFKKPVPSVVKIITGISSIFVAFLMSYSILTNQNIDELLKIGFHFVPVWMFLLGLRDIILYRDKYNIESKQPLVSE